MKAQTLYNQYAGRCLLASELAFELGLSLATLQPLLMELCDRELVQEHPAIRTSSWAIRRKCYKCGAGPTHIAVSACASCGNSACAYCTHCLFYGRAKSCNNLYTFIPLKVKPTTPDITLFPLNDAQHQTWNKWQQILASGKKHLDVVLVEASGKMILLVHSIVQLLKQQKQIFLCVAPNQLEKICKQLQLLVPPLAKIAQTPGDHSFVVGTKWDLLTYVQRFDLIIWDEIDDTLPVYWRRALRPAAQQVYLHSSLPHGGADVIHPVRLHQQPLPLLAFIQKFTLRRQLQANRPMVEFQAFFEQVQSNGGQALLVVPTREMCEQVMGYMERVFPQLASETAFVTSSVDGNMDRIKILFFDKKLTFLVTSVSSALDFMRPNLHLLVLFADHRLFTKQRLIQLCSLAGQHANFPTGEIWLIGETKTKAIVSTKKEQQLLNELAKKEGYFKKES